MKNKIAIFICFLIITLFILNKPLYVVLFFTIFSYEYFLFIGLISSFLKAKKSDHYTSFSVTPLKTTKINTYKIWLKINEIYAYRRLYRMLLTKKFSFKTILFSVVIILLDFPLKVYEIVKFLLRHNLSLNESLVHFYFKNYETVKDAKIEIIFKKVYLNPSTRVEVFNKIKELFPGSSSWERAVIYQKLVKINFDFIIKNNANYSRGVDFHLGHLTTQEGYKIPVPHYSYVDTWQIYGDRVLLNIHATSKVPDILESSQLASIPILDLWKPNSKNAGSIISHGDFKFEVIYAEVKRVHAWQVHESVYNVYKSNLNTPFAGQFDDHFSTVKEILGPNASNEIVKEFSSGIHYLVLKNDVNKSIKEILNEIDDIDK